MDNIIKYSENKWIFFYHWNPKSKAMIDIIHLLLLFKVKSNHFELNEYFNINLRENIES